MEDAVFLYAKQDDKNVKYIPGLKIPDGILNIK